MRLAGHNHNKATSIPALGDKDQVIGVPAADRTYQILPSPWPFAVPATESPANVYSNRELYAS